jgi:hypothetical protein
MLNLRKAILLIEILDPYIPEFPDLDAPILEFVGKILSNIVESNSHADYLAATELMSNVPVDDLLAMPVEEVFGLFTDGLIENQILALMDFYRGLGKSIWQTKPL